MVELFRVPKLKWLAYRRTLVSAQLHITYLRFQAWLQPNLLRSNQHVTWTSPLIICFIERLDPNFLERALPRRSWMDSEHETIVRPPLTTMQPVWMNLEGLLISYWVQYRFTVCIWDYIGILGSLKHSRICTEHFVSWLPVCLFLPDGAYHDFGFRNIRPLFQSI